MITRRHVMYLLAVATTLLLTMPGAALADTSLGLHGGFSSGPDQFIVGPHLNLSPIADNLYIVPGAEVGFGDNLTTLAFNGDLQYRFGTSSEVRPYVGGGPALIWFDSDGGGSDTNIGVHILGGILFGRLNGQPMFVDVKAGLTDEVPDWKFQFGFNF